jgi:hypothetical protein
MKMFQMHYRSFNTLAKDDVLVNLDCDHRSHTTVLLRARYRHEQLEVGVVGL